MTQGAVALELASSMLMAFAGVASSGMAKKCVFQSAMKRLVPTPMPCKL
jgi:hypothetical protein